MSVTLSIKVQGLGDHYASLVSSFVAQDFPRANVGNFKTTLDAVTAAFVASNQIRFGPAPDRAGLDSIRKVIRKRLDEEKPIPVLTPFGSRKSRLGEPLDIAEVAALKQLAALQKRVCSHYPPGIQVNLRLDDTSGHYLFADEGIASRLATKQYCLDFSNLVQALQLSSFIRPVSESMFFDEEDYTKTCDSIAPVLRAYIVDTDACGFNGYEQRDSWKDLADFGWQGCIPLEMRQYYRSLYDRLYPGIQSDEATTKLARFFATAWARIQHKGTGADREWGNDYIRVTFVNPIPGVPIGMFTRQIHYRTLPLVYAKTHMPPWRGKGYLKIGKAIIPKVTSWREQQDYQPGMLEIQWGRESLHVKSDYIICD